MLPSRDREEAVADPFSTLSLSADIGALAPRAPPFPWFDFSRILMNNCATKRLTAPAVKPIPGFYAVPALPHTLCSRDRFDRRAHRTRLPDSSHEAPHPRVLPDAFSSLLRIPG